MMLGLMCVQSQQENPIKHLIVLMMENRSFDHYLGWLKEQNPAIDGLTGSEANCVVPGNASSGCVTVSKDGYDTVTTHIFDPDDIYINNDAVFGVKESLIAEFVKVEDEARIKEAGFTNEYYWDVDFDFVLAPKS